MFTTSSTVTAGAGPSTSAEAAPSSAQAVGVAHSFDVQQCSNTEEGEVAIQVNFGGGERHYPVGTD